MPTRIALKSTLPPRVEPRLRKGKAYSAGFMRRESVSERGEEEEDGLPRNALTTPKTTNGNRTVTMVEDISNSSSAPINFLPGFRSSILRELSVRNDDDDEGEEVPSPTTATAVDDIRASPRLLGYLFSTIAGAVMLVSVVQFYRQRSGASGVVADQIDNDNDENDDDDETLDFNKYYYVFGNTVYRWKLWGAIYASSAGAIFSLLTILAHFDTFVFPKLWERVFRDGSLLERNWILFLILFWGGAVHVCTSTLSVGESQANVFFTSWIAFSSLATNYGVWRESAGLSPLTIMGKKRETTYHWIWIGLFSVIFAGAATDMYSNRNEVVLRYRGQPLDLVTKDWIIILTVVWSEVTLCIIAILLNESFEDSWTLPCVMKRPDARYRCVFGWRQLEGFVILVATGCKFWVILEYATVDGVIAGLSNAYFGVWGSFFNGVFALGTWLRENKNIAYIVREDPNDNNEDNVRSETR